MLLYSIIGIVSVLGNILVVCVVRKSKELRHTQYVYKSSIAVADIIWGLSISYVFLQQCFLIISKNIVINEFENFYLTTIYLNKSDILVYDYKINELFLEQPLFNDGVFELVFLVVMEFLAFIFLPITILVSIVTLVFSAADRYFALTFPFKYKTTNTKKIAKVISTLIWVIITSVYITFFLFKAEQSSLVYSFVLQPCSSCTTESVMQRFNMIVIFVLFFLLLVFTVLTLFNLKNNYEKSKKLNRRAQKAFAAEKQMSFILILMVFAFTFSLLPTMYNYIYSTFFKTNLAKDISSYNIIFTQ